MDESQQQQGEVLNQSLANDSLDGILLTDEQGILNFVSPSVNSILGYCPDDINGSNISDIIYPGDKKFLADAFRETTQRTTRVKSISIRLLKNDGTCLWCRIRLHNLLDQPPFNSIAICFTDDNKRKETEEKLIKSEELFRNLIYNLNNGILLLDENGRIIICNYSAQHILGLSESELLGSGFSYPRWNTVHEDGQPFQSKDFPDQVVFQTREGVHDIVMGVLKGTERVWLLVNASPDLDKFNKVVNVIISFTDITERKKLSQQLVEQEIQKQKQLTQATIFGQEKERREIGKELHDNINQHLTTTKLYLEVAKEKASGEVKEMITLSHKSLTNTINEIRLMSQSLVPPTLGDLGLVESVQDLCDALRRAHTFSVDFNYRYFNEDNLPGELRLILFRIVQEQINNIIRHAHATHIQIKLESDAEHIILTITDNGHGFDKNSVKRGLGFSNIRNRAELFNGKLEIESVPGKGCMLTVSIPQMPDGTDMN